MDARIHFPPPPPRLQAASLPLQRLGSPGLTPFLAALSPFVLLKEQPEPQVGWPTLECGSQMEGLSAELPSGGGPLWGWGSRGRFAPGSAGS